MKKGQNSDIIELLKCSNKKCKKEIDAFKKFQDKGYKKLEILRKNLKLKKISKEKYQKENKKIIEEINNKKETLDYIKCRIDNCNTYIKNTINYIIYYNNIKNTKIKNNIDIKNLFIKLGIIYS